MKSLPKQTFDPVGEADTSPATSVSGGEVISSSETTRLLGRFISFPPTLAREIGIEETLFLINILFSSQSEGEWVKRDAVTLEEETCLTYKQQLRIRDHLKAAKLLEEKVGRNEVLFRVNEASYDALIVSLKTKRKSYDLPKVSPRSSEREVLAVTKGKSSGDVSIIEEEVQEQKQEGTSVREVLEERKENPAEVFKLCKKYYRRATGKSCGNVPPSRAEEWIELIQKKTGDVVYEAFKLWVDESGREFLRNMRWPFAVFMKSAQEKIEEYEDKVIGEQEQEGEASDVPALKDWE